MPVYAVVPQSLTVSSGVVLERPERPFVVIVPASITGASLTLQFANTDITASAVVSYAYGSLFRADGTGAINTVYSGALAGVSAPIQAPTPWVRVVLGAAQSQVQTFTLQPTFSS